MRLLAHMAGFIPGRRPTNTERTMTKEQLAALLNGRQYRQEITKDEEAAAKAAGLLVIFGASDDLVELRGAISDQVGAYEGSTVRISKAGALIQDFESIDRDDEEALEAYFKAKAAGFVEVEAVWSPAGEDLSWAFKTEVPHATFTIAEEGEPDFCRGIVIDMADLKA